MALVGPVVHRNDTTPHILSLEKEVADLREKADAYDKLASAFKNQPALYDSDSSTNRG